MQTDIQAGVLFIGEMTSNEPRRRGLRASITVTQQRRALLSEGSVLPSCKPNRFPIGLSKPSQAWLGARCLHKWLVGRERGSAAATQPSWAGVAGLGMLIGEWSTAAVTPCPHCLAGPERFSPSM